MSNVKYRVELTEAESNARGRTVDWQFTTEDARVKLRHLYPKIELN